MDRTCVLAATVASAAAGCTASSAGTTAGQAVAPTIRVGCSEITDRTQRPFTDGYRRVLDVFAAPPGYIPQVVRNTDRRWPWWEKAGLVVRAGRRPVEVRVPASWQGRAAITWGNGGLPSQAVRFAPCPSPPGVWNAYAGGFLLRSRGACVPLVFQAGGERRIVRFGIGVRCGGAA